MQASLQRTLLYSKPLAELLGQAKKSAGWMPWHEEPMKDVISCDKLRGGAHIH